MSSKWAKLSIGVLATFAVVAMAKDRLDPFFANQAMQQKAPKAFVLQPATAGFVRAAFPKTLRQAEDLVIALKDHETLSTVLANWNELSFEKQQPHLQQLLELQCELMGVTAPQLIVDSESYPERLAFFDFDPNNPDAGKVFLHKERFATQQPVVTLALLIHETRHAYQFQAAYQHQGMLAETYHAAFEAQHELQPRSFADFLTLANEYEAFQFSNYVIGELFDWRIDLPSMGTYASQYWADKRLKIDLIEMIDSEDPTPLIDLFNQRLASQKQQLGR